MFCAFFVFLLYTFTHTLKKDITTFFLVSV